MSEAEDATATQSGRNEIWIEKYRPETLADIKGHEHIVNNLAHYVERDDLPHLLFAGPAGIGKCVTGETPVLTGHGVERIEDVVGDVEGFGSPGEGLEILTFDKHGEFEYVEPSHVFSKVAEGTVEIETRDGNEFATTPEHRVLVATPGGLEWRTAENVSGGDRIARPLSIPSVDSNGYLDWFSRMDGERTYVTLSESFAREHKIHPAENHVGIKRSVLRRLDDSDDLIVEALNVRKKIVQEYRRQVDGFDEAFTQTCSLAYLRERDIDETTIKDHVESIEYVTPQNTRSRAISPPREMSPALASLVGLSISEARIDGGRIRFYNTDEGLLSQFENAAHEVFDVDTRRGKQKGVPFVDIRSRTLTHFLETCFDVFDGAADGDGISSAMLTADEESRSAFLRAVFDAEGHVTSQGILELTQKNGDLVTALSYLLATFGVPTRRKTVQKSATNGQDEKQTYHTLFISSASHLARFQSVVGFTIDRKAERLATNAERDSNPNHDTIPAQRAVDVLCDRLNLTKRKHVPETWNPSRPGRESYIDALDSVVTAANTRLEGAQDALQVVDELRPMLSSVTMTPTAWAHGRSILGPLETRRQVSERTGIRSDRLLEYANGRRTPTAQQAGNLLVTVGANESWPAIETVQQHLQAAIDALGVSYREIAEPTPYRGTDISNLLQNDDHAVRSLTRFTTVADRIETIATEMLSEETLEQITALEQLAKGTLYFDEVVDVDTDAGERRVYDLTVPRTHNYVAGAVPTVMHNTTAATAIARELYGDDWRENFLELNASDQRGIDVVRDRIKNFARSSFGGYDYRIIFLDEADALTSDAQSALRRTMEKFSNNTRFILSCNYSSQIIDPIQSRCAVFRFTPLSDDAVEAQIREIAAAEDIELTDDGVEALVYAAAGDMRKAINALQAAAVMGERVDEDAVFSITSTARPEEVAEMVTAALDGEFVVARERLNELLTEKGIAGGDIIDQLHRSVWEFDLTDRETVRLMDRIGETDYRITQGANERLQLEALLASLALDD